MFSLYIVHRVTEGDESILIKNEFLIPYRSNLPYEKYVGAV